MRGLQNNSIVLYVRIFNFHTLNNVSLQCLIVIFFEVLPFYPLNCHFPHKNLIGISWKNSLICFTHTHTHKFFPDRCNQLHLRFIVFSLHLFSFSIACPVRQSQAQILRNNISTNKIKTKSVH